MPLHPVKHNLLLFIHLLPQSTQWNDISRKIQFIPEAEKHSLDLEPEAEVQKMQKELLNLTQDPHEKFLPV